MTKKFSIRDWVMPKDYVLEEEKILESLASNSGDSGPREDLSLRHRGFTCTFLERNGDIDMWLFKSYLQPIPVYFIVLNPIPFVYIRSIRVTDINDNTCHKAYGDIFVVAKEAAIKKGLYRDEED